MFNRVGVKLSNKIESELFLVIFESFGPNSAFPQNILVLGL